jgi:5-formaminoimidazole-4-carboxamide-1-beta-D-ribofuranosyl 5'-monophosphate synthetase
MAACYQNLTLGALSSRSALSMLVGALFKNFGLQRTAYARAQFSGSSSTTNSHSETGQIAVCCQNLTLGALSSRSALSVLVGAQFKKFRLFLNTVVQSVRILGIQNLKFIS